MDLRYRPGAYIFGGACVALLLLFCMFGPSILILILGRSK